MIDVANSGDQIDLRTGNSDRVRIDSDGLTVKNNGDVRLYTSGSQVGWIIYILLLIMVNTLMMILLWVMDQYLYIIEEVIMV